MLFLHNQVNKIRSPKQQQGVVIIVALFIVALVAVMSFFMMSRLERDTRRTSLILRNTEAEYYAQGSIVWAMDQLRNNWERQRPNKLVDVMPMKSPEIKQGPFKIFSVIYDLQGRFNINSVINEEMKASFVRLLKAVDARLTEEKSRDIASALFDWITPIPQQNELSKYYLNQPVPYSAAHQAALSISELRLIKGVTSSLFNTLKPYISALPKAPINVQSASVPVLMTLSPKITVEMAKSIVKAREQAPFVNLQNFLNLEALKGQHIATENIVNVSSYFLVETNVIIEKQHVVLYTLLERTTKQNDSQINILWQSKSLAE